MLAMKADEQGKEETMIVAVPGTRYRGKQVEVLVLSLLLVYWICYRDNYGRTLCSRLWLSSKRIVVVLGRYNDTARLICVLFRSEHG